MSMDRLIDLIRARKNPTVAGLDPRLDFLPPAMLARHLADGETLQNAAAAVAEFNRGLIEALCDIVPAVKFQVACYEALGVEGMATLRRSMDYARTKGMYVIADGKRNDIGSTAESYASAWLGTIKVGTSEIAPFDADALTVSAYLGIDGIEPFLKQCALRDKGLFMLVRTSNPSARDLQDLESEGEKIYKIMAGLCARWGESLEGKYGYSSLGAVVGATYPEQIIQLRQEFPGLFFLIPGYGAQGGSAADVAHAFDVRGLGGIVNSSRAIMCAWQKTGKEGSDYAEAARDEALAMRRALEEHITIA